MRRLDPSRLLLSGLLALLVAASWATGCGEPPTSGPDAALPAADAGPLPADASAQAPDAAALPPDADAPPADAAAEPADATVVAPPDAAAPGEDAAGAPADAAGPTADAGAEADAGVSVPLPGFGAISGECGVLDVELTDGNAYLFESHLDFGTDPYDDPADRSQLTAAGQKIEADPNAGGSSKHSEAFAIEVLVRCELATLLKTEMEIVYVNPQGKITDELVEMDAEKIGVSITRAMSYPEGAAYPVATAQSLLEKKLQGILDSTANVSAQDKWKKQVLSILAQSQAHADAMRTAWANVSATLKADTIVYVTVTDGTDQFIYYE